MIRDTACRLLALEAHLGVADLAPTFATPTPEIIGPGDATGGFEVVKVMPGEDPASVEARIRAVE